MLRAASILFAFVFLIHANALTAFFVGDDYDFLRLVSGMDGFVETAQLQFWEEWEPAWYLSWYIDFQIWEYNPLGYHLTNVLWLALAVIALFALVRELWPAAPMAAWAAALLFATHPIHDEAVTYLAARGHIMCLALLFFATLLYARSRRSDSSRTARAMQMAGALVCAFLATLAKETALILPVWIGTLEWLVLDRTRPVRQAWRRGVVAGAVFMLPGLLNLGARQVMVGLRSGKLKGPGTDWAELADDVVDYLPDYALLGGTPFPFAFLDYPWIQSFVALGWLLILAAVVAGGVGLVVAATRRGHPPSAAAGLLAFGLVVIATSLAPLFWADLPPRRRYLFVPSAGIVLMLAVGLQWFRQRFARGASALLIVLVVLGAAGTLYRNDLYRRGGTVVRHLIETVRGAPLDEPVIRGRKRPPRPVFVALPGRYGGDFVSGAYLLHSSDLRSAFEIFGVKQADVVYGLGIDHAHDHHEEILSRTEHGLRLGVSYRTRRAFAAALRRDPAAAGKGDRLTAERLSVDAEGLGMTYALTWDPIVERLGYELYLYSDERFRPVGLRNE